MSTEAVTSTGHNLASLGNSKLGGEGVNGTGAGCTKLNSFIKLFQGVRCWNFRESY